MAHPNGRMPAAALAALPPGYSNKRKTEYLRADAAAALTRAMLRAVAATGTNFSVWSAYRSFDEQVTMLRQNYQKVRGPRLRRTDRSYAGSTWRQKPGRPATASPGHSNHGNGLAIDIHPAPIQQWMQRNGARFGWSWAEGKRLGEPWHFVYDPRTDRYTSEGTPNIIGLQKALGIAADGKFGTGTAAAVRTWQAANGLTADGIPGPTTLPRILKNTTSTTAPAAALAEVVKAAAEASTPLPGVEVDYQPTPNVWPGRVRPASGRSGELESITIHHWGRDGQKHDNVVDWLTSKSNKSSSAHEVISGKRVTILAGADDATWHSGSETGNLTSYGIECRPEADEDTLSTVAARIRALRAETGKPLPLRPHSSWTSTSCPGRYTDLLADLDAAARGTKPVPTPPMTTPAAPSTRAAAALPEGKALMTALTSIPDFPLLRTPGHLCYYGPRSGPAESVSGHVPNALNLGEVRGGAQGLKAWQQQMRKRGYSIAADGLYGPATRAAAINLQRLAGLTQDGLIGPHTFYAAYLLPVVR